jgi:hypothetical protein
LVLPSAPRNNLHATNATFGEEDVLEICIASKVNEATLSNGSEASEINMDGFISRSRRILIHSFY